MPQAADSVLVDVSVLITNWNGQKMLEDCLRSLRRKTTSVTYEIVVVDDGSTDGSVEMLRREFPDVLLLQNQQNLGFVRANNRGVQATRGRYVLLLNSDTILPRDSVGILARFLDDHPGTGVCGAWLKNADGSSQVSYGWFPSLLQAIVDALFLNSLFPESNLPKLAAFPPARVHHPKPVCYVSGAAFMIRHSLIETLGLFDERFIAYCEEVDLCYRVRHAARQEVYFVPEATVLHLGGGSYGKLPEYRIQLVYSGYDRFLKKYHGGFYTLSTRVLYAWHHGVKALARFARWLISGKRTRAQRHAMLRHALLSVRFSLLPGNPQRSAVLTGTAPAVAAAEPNQGEIQS
jgi:N-acetylglucosaminyl-diphospho-decaprenol L-rhamnosyltransferase